MKMGVSLLCGIGLCAGAHAQMFLVGWNFNQSNTGNLGDFDTAGEVEIYDPVTKTLSMASHGIHASTAKIDLSNLVGQNGGSSTNNWGTLGGDLMNAAGDDYAGNAFALSGTSNNSKSILFTFSTVGAQEISLSYATRGTGTGFKSQLWEWSANGEDWVVWQNVEGIGNTYSLKELPEISGLDNLEIAYVRVTFDGAMTGFNPFPAPGITTDNGNNRIDNLQVLAAVPEVNISAMLGVGLPLLFMCLRRNRKRLSAW